MSEKSVFETLNALDVSDSHKKKGNNTYLPWSVAWAEIKKLYPDAVCVPVKSPEGNLYHTDGKTCWVETSMTINGETQNEVLAVMNHRNASIAVDEVTSTDFARSLKRCMVKNAALFGLDLNLWNGEELSDAAKVTRAKKQAEDEAAELERRKAEAVLVKSRAKIIELCSTKKEQGVDPTKMYAIIEKYTGGKKNPNAIKSIEDSQACYKEIEAMKA